jgi:hypothetical protein
MKTLRLLAIIFTLCASALAWNCPAGQIRQQAPAGTPTTTQYYDVVEGIAFICVPTPTSVAPTGVTNTLSNTNNNTVVNTNTASSVANSTSNSSASANQKQQQKQTQSQVATGGNASSISTAAGGSATATGNGDNSNNTTVEAPKIPVASAIAPMVLPSAPCIKGYSGAAQGGVFGASFGAGKIDEGCDIREMARSFTGISKIAQCKLLVNEKQSKKAGITLEDCLGVDVVQKQSIPDVHDMKNFPEPTCIEVLTTKDGFIGCLRYSEKN